MKIPIYLAAALLFAVLLATLRGAPSTSAESTGVDSPSSSRHPDLEYFKAINTIAPPQDPQLLFLLMAQAWTMLAQQAERIEAPADGVDASSTIVLPKPTTH